MIITLIVLLVGAYMVFNSLGTAKMRSGVDYAESNMMPQIITHILTLILKRVISPTLKNF